MENELCQPWDRESSQCHFHHSAAECPQGICPCMNPSSPTGAAASWEDQHWGFHMNELCLLGTMQGQCVMSALTATFPSASAECVTPGPTAALRMCWKDSSLCLGTGTGRRRAPGGSRARGSWDSSWLQFDSSTPLLCDNSFC